MSFGLMHSSWPMILCFYWMRDEMSVVRVLLLVVFKHTSRINSMGWQGGGGDMFMQCEYFHIYITAFRQLGKSLRILNLGIDDCHRILNTIMCSHPESIKYSSCIILMTMNIVALSYAGNELHPMDVSDTVANNKTRTLNDVMIWKKCAYAPNEWI